MRKVLRSLLAAAVLAAAPLAAGCGADDLNPEDVAKAAEATRAEKTAKVDLSVATSGFGVPVPLNVKGTGTSALDRVAMDLTFDLSGLLSLAGIQGDGRTRAVVLGKDAWLDPPAVDGLTVPGGKRWVGVDLARAARATGVDPEAIGALVNADPGAQLDAITQAKGVKEVGKEQVGGVETTHFTGTVRLQDFLAALPADQRAKAQEALEAFTKGAPGGDQPMPIDVWVDGDERIRRMRQEIRTPAQGGIASGRIGLSFDYSDFGTPLKVQAPAAGETFDSTKALGEAFAAAPRGATL